MPIKDLAGMNFGRLTAIEPAGRNRHGSVLWRCACTCGGSHVVDNLSLQHGKSKSCGCLKRDTPAHNRTHNMRHSPLYGVWATMRNRCQNSNATSYADYGGRGIKVCDRWQKFENFLADMGERPSGAHTLERIDNARGYEPGNCRWATRSEQAVNKRNNRLITAGGETQPLTEWARRLGCNPAAILARIKGGMPEVDAVMKPIPDKPNAKLTAEDAQFIRSNYGAMSSTVLAEKFGVSKKTILNVIHGKTFPNTKKEAP